MSMMNSNVYAEKNTSFIEEINAILLDAVRLRASDIHVEPCKSHVRLRYRIDGLLHEIQQIPQDAQARMTSRLKLMGDLDISERRLPQDGHFSLNLEKNDLDFRISSCPVLFGEKIVIRILNDKPETLTLDELGLTENQKKLLLQRIRAPQGLILITGPTGSGKTITLYSLLTLLNKPEKNIATVEDPVEIQLDGINQVNINPKAGLDFSRALRAFLRQDPDILMIGEIRDRETANIALKAAQTGHLVLCTLHTNSAIESIHRLSNMGIEPYNIASALSLVVAQRLVRKICVHCRGAVQGCAICTGGFHGRTGVFECLPITPKLASAIAAKESLASLLSEMNILSLKESAQQKLRNGITTQDEIMRVIYHD